MAKNTYSPIKTQSTKDTFIDYVGSLDIPQIDYIAVGVQNTFNNTSISMMSLAEWQSHFTRNLYADHDPIRKVTLHTNRNIIPFTQIDYVDNFGKEIMLQRNRFGIKNGIILMQRHPKFNYMITLGSGFSQFDAFEFFRRYHDKISLMKNDLIALIEKEAKTFLSSLPLNTTNRLSSDAK